jgi:hypothetical protein
MPHATNPDKVAAEAYRVLKPAGRFAYASWCEPAKCIALSMVYDAIREHGSLDVGLPPGPDFFGCGRPDYAGQMLNGRGILRRVDKRSPAVLARVFSRHDH